MSYGNGTRNRVIDRAFETLLFVAGRYATTSQELAVELGVHRRQAQRYLKALGESHRIPTTIREEAVGSRMTHYYQIIPEWRKRHGFL